MHNNFSLVPNLDPTDPRIPKYLKQQEERGFDDTELWNLDVTISKFVLPRLKAFKEYTLTGPVELSHDEWQDTLQKMIDAFEQISDVTIGENEIITLGLSLFHRYFLRLWD